MTPKQIESYKKWHDKTVKQCKNCGDKCFILTQGEKINEKNNTITTRLQ